MTTHRRRRRQRITVHYKQHTHWLYIDVAYKCGMDLKRKKFMFQYVTRILNIFIC